MSDTTFVNQQTVILADWLNDVNNLTYSGIRTFKQAGAVGDGVTNDAAAIQSAITQFAGKVIDGGGLTYKCNSPITNIASNTVIQNAKFDFSSMPAQSGQDKCFNIAGTKGTAVALTSNLLTGEVTVAVGSTSSFTDEQWVWLQSTAVWGSSDGTYYGQYVKIKSIDSATQLTLYEGPIVDFTTAATATISPVAMKENVYFKNVTITGAQANSQVGIWFEYAQDCGDINCTFLDVDYSSVTWWRCVNPRGNAIVKRARSVGLAYGYVVAAGTYGGSVIGGYGEDIRHYVTIGDNDGININIKANFNVVYGATSAGVDGHLASYGTQFIGNQITLANGAADEGITYQGLNGTIINNHIRNCTGVGIYSQPLVTNGYLTNNIIANNHIYFNPASTTTVVGIAAYIDSTGRSPYNGVSIIGNHFYGATPSAPDGIHIYVYNNDAKALDNVVIANNISVDPALGIACWVRANAASATITDVSITGNVFKTSGSRCLYILSNNATATISDVTITGNSFSGGSVSNIAISSTGTISNVVEGNNVFSGGAALFNIAGAGTLSGLRLNSLRDQPPTTVTNNTVTIGATTNAYIFNRAGTVTATLPAASIYPGREIMTKTIQAQAVDSASSNVAPIGDSVAGTSILPATDGAWARIMSDGTNWIVMSRG